MGKQGGRARAQARRGDKRRRLDARQGGSKAAAGGRAGAGHLDDVLQLAALLRGLGHLLGVARRHRDDRVGRLDGALEEVEHRQRRVGHLLRRLEPLGLLLLLADLERLHRLHRLDDLLREVEALRRLGVEGEAALEGQVVQEHHRLGVGPALALLAGHLEVHGDERGVPVVGDEDHVLAVGKAAERELLRGNERRLAEHGEAELVVLVVLAPLRAVELLLGLAPDLLEEERVVDEDAVDALLEGVEEAHGRHRVAQRHLGGELSVPRVVVLVVAGGDGHDSVALLGERARQTVAYLQQNIQVLAVTLEFMNVSILERTAPSPPVTDQGAISAETNTT